jgi:hypothetical protein
VLAALASLPRYGRHVLWPPTNGLRTGRHDYCGRDRRVPSFLRRDGPLAAFLTVRPADLTALSKRNNGRFPSERVPETIDGRMQVKGHGTREMPVWETRHEADIARQYGPYGSEAMVQARILELVRYLQSIQIE